jgi:hypothetical protein
VRRELIIIGDLAEITNSERSEKQRDSVVRSLSEMNGERYAEESSAKREQEKVIEDISWN